MSDVTTNDGEIRSKIADLEHQLSSLKRLVDQQPTVSTPAVSSDLPVEAGDTEPTSRRRWIAGAGAAAAGAVIAASTSRPVAAADPNDIVKDVNNAVGGTTTLTGGKFRVRDTGSTLLLGFSGKVEGIAGSESFNGVIGSTRSPGGYGMIAMADRAAGARAQLILEPNGPPPPTGGANRPGEFAVDANNDLWFATSGATSVKLAGPATAGALHAIDPVRVFDSRLAAIPNSGIFGPGSNRTISVKDGFDLAGVVSDADVVPAGATAIVFNLTVTGTTGPNFISVVPGSAATFATSSINFDAGQTLANGLTVGLDDNRQVKVFAGAGSGSTHVLIDVSGYHL